MTKERRFYYQKVWYVGYISTEPADSRPIVRVVYDCGGEEVVDNIELLRYAHDLFEDLGYI